MNKPHRWKFLNQTLKWTLALSALSVNFAVNAVIWPATPAGSKRP